MKLLKADYHGCMITVRKTKCPSLLGLSGIVLMETRNTFKIISKDDKLKCKLTIICIQLTHSKDVDLLCYRHSKVLMGLIHVAFYHALVTLSFLETCIIGK